MCKHHRPGRGDGRANLVRHSAGGFGGWAGQPNSFQGAANGARDAPQIQSIINNCATLGLPTDLTQANPQLSALSAGNENLIAETSDNTALGIVYSSVWAKDSNWADGFHVLGFLRSDRR